MPSSILSSDLISLLIHLAEQLPDEQVTAVAGILQNITIHQLSPYQFQSCLPDPDWQRSLHNLLEQWKKDNQPQHGSYLAVGLQTYQQISKQSNTMANELLWTGPLNDQAWLRRSDQAILQLINEAKEEVIGCTFSLTATEELVHSLTQAIQRGVSCRFIVETPQDSQGYLYYSEVLELKTKVPGLEILEWPLHKRSNENGKCSLIHAKFLLVDMTHLLVTSANFTRGGLGRNLEVGIISHQPEIAKLLRKQISYMEIQKILV